MKELISRKFSVKAKVALLAASAVGWAWAQPALVPAVQQYVAGEGEYVVKAPSVEVLAIAETKDGAIPSEGYVLTIAPGGIAVKSSDAAGAFYARQTLKQLAAPTGKGELKFPCATITDAPRFKWRGAMLDDCRHFFGKEVVKRMLDQMAAHKMNVFHWHLTEDQGWRLEIPKYPELVKYGAVRPASPAYGARMKWNNGQMSMDLNTEPYGPYYYTEADVKEILAYAKARFITVVPEIELPGHAFAALAAYPEMACVPENLRARHPRILWGIEKDVICVGNPAGIKFYEDVLDYVCELFPGEVIHIGGDETPRARWKECPKCQKFVKDHGLKDENDIQPWVTRHFADYLAKKGRRILGWDEILAGDVPTSAMGMSWRVNKKGGAGTPFVSGAAGAMKGHDMVMSPKKFCYLDYGQGLAEDPYQYIGGTLTLEQVYAFDPCAGIDAASRAHVLGGQCNNWSEYTWNRFDLEWKMWPRAAAIAEVLWTYPAQPRDFAAFAARMETHRRRLIKAGINCAPLK